MLALFVKRRAQHDVMSLFHLKEIELQPAGSLGQSRLNLILDSSLDETSVLYLRRALQIFI